jgi:hypothetical protein
MAPIAASSLETEPWFDTVQYQFMFRGDYAYSRYSKVQNALIPLKSPSNDQLIALDIHSSLFENLQTELEMEFVDTPRQRWGLRSSCLQVRYEILDDLEGDLFTLTAGFNGRYVTKHSVRDISSPYHFYFNTEINLSIGKEWSQEAYWLFHPYLFLGVGEANRGSPWIRSILAFQGNIVDRHRYKVYADGYFGFGSQEKVNIEHFHGYARIAHRSIDLGASYTYLLDIWGSFTFEYAYRVYARSFPEHLNLFLFRYELPFSLF